MKTIFNVARTELRTLFYSPIAWMLLIIFLVQSASNYFDTLAYYTGVQEKGGNYLEYLSGLTRRIFLNPFNGFMNNVSGKLFFYIPLISMALISRETASGTIRLLLSSPLKIWQIVSGKYLAMVLFSALMALLVLIFIILGIIHIQHADYGILLSGALGIFLLLCTYSAIGMFMSSITTYQIIAAIGTFALIALLDQIGSWWQDVEWLSYITYNLSLSRRLGTFLNGLTTSRDLIYFLFVSVFFLYLTYNRLRTNIEAASMSIRAGRTMMAVFLLAVGCTLIARPGLTLYYDATADHSNTLDPEVQDILKKMDGDKINITLYSNLLSGFASVGMPGERTQTLSNWDNYLRFRPEMHFNFVQYWAEPHDQPETPFSILYPGKTLAQAAKQAIYGSGLRKAKINTPEEQRAVLDLEPELNRTVMQVKYNGDSSFLRLFNDPVGWPLEEEVGAVFKKLIHSQSPKITFVTGHYERSIYETNERAYSIIISDKTTRKALINQGFDVDTVNMLKQKIPENTSILIISDPRTKFDTAELSAVRQYVASGRNLVVAGEPGKQSIVNHLLKELGVKMANKIEEQKNNLSPDFIITGQPLPGGTLGDSQAKGQKIGWQGVAAIEADSGSDFRIKPIAESRSGAFLATLLSRNIAGKQQRIVVAGDADFLSNGVLQFREPRLNNLNFSLDLFNWLSYEEFPIRTKRINIGDDTLNTTTPQVARLKIVFVYAIPGLLGLMGAIVLLKRRSK